MKKTKLDEIDITLLSLLQSDARLTNVALAALAGLSPPPCSRRVRALEEAGYIRGFHADLDGGRLGFAVTVFALVGLESQAEVDLQAFEARVADWPEVRECHMLNGDIDFILKCVARDLSAFQSFLTERLTPAPNVAQVRTSMTIRRSKYVPGVPLIEK